MCVCVVNESRAADFQKGKIGNNGTAIRCDLLEVGCDMKAEAKEIVSE